MNALNISSNLHITVDLALPKVQPRVAIAVFVHLLRSIKFCNEYSILLLYCVIKTNSVQSNKKTKKPQSSQTLQLHTSQALKLVEHFDRTASIRN